MSIPLPALAGEALPDPGDVRGADRAAEEGEQVDVVLVAIQEGLLLALEIIDRAGVVRQARPSRRRRWCQKSGAFMELRPPETAAAQARAPLEQVLRGRGDRDPADRARAPSGDRRRPPCGPPRRGVSGGRRTFTGRVVTACNSRETLQDRVSVRDQPRNRSFSSGAPQLDGVYNRGGRLRGGTGDQPRPHRRASRLSAAVTSPTFSGTTTTWPVAASASEAAWPPSGSSSPWLSGTRSIKEGQEVRQERQVGAVPDDDAQALASQLREHRRYRQASGAAMTGLRSCRIARVSPFSGRNTSGRTTARSALFAGGPGRCRARRHSGPTLESDILARPVESIGVGLDQQRPRARPEGQPRP